MLTNHNNHPGQLERLDLHTKQIPENEIKYNWGDQIGRGGFSDVYKALWNGSIVAVKQLNLESSDADKIRDEIKIMFLLDVKQVPNVVKFHGYILKACNAQDIVMDIMPNGSLRSIIDTKEVNVLSFSQKYQILNDIVTALVFIHNLNIIHRDLKSGNVLLDEKFRAKLADFGSATEIESASPIFGASVKWAAPEVFEGGLQTPKMDVYSFSVFMWEIIAWKKPFNDIDSYLIDIPEEVCKNDLREMIPDDCQPKLAKLIRWGWQKNPDNRPTSTMVQEELITGIDECSERLTKLAF